MKFKSFKKHTHDILIFRKWGRKPYSSFLTLKRTVAIAVLSVVYFLSTPVISLAIEQDTTDVKMEYDLDEIEVSAQRTPALYSQVARIVSVIERKEIEAAPVQNVQDLLEYVAGIDVRQRGTEGVQADISIRGGTFDQILILLNGINITDPQTGHHNLNLPVSLAQIERIEVLEGPAARVYGPNAFSGAINIVTRQDDSNSMTIGSSGGSFGYYDGDVSASVKNGLWNHSGGVSYKRSDGYTNNTDFTDLNGFYSNRLNAKTGKLSFQLGASTKGFGANSFYTPVYPNQYEATKTLFSSVRWESSGKFHFAPAVYYRRHQDRFELFREKGFYEKNEDGLYVWDDDVAGYPWIDSDGKPQFSPYTGHNYHLTNVYGVGVNSWAKWKLGKTALGVEYRSENILSNVLGKDMDKPKKVPGEDAFFTKSDSRNTFSLFLEHTVYMQNWIFTAGILANTISGSDPGVNFFPGLDVSYQINDYLKCYGSYNTSLRMPTFTDLYYQGPTNVGNPDLKPEKSETLEGGFKLNQNILRGHLVVFYRKGRDIIDWVRNDSSEKWQPQNLTELNSLGTEIQVEMLLQKKYGRFYPNIRASFLYNDLNKKKGDFISRYVLDNLKNKMVGSISQPILSNLTINLEIVYQDREGGYTKYENMQAVGEAEYKPFWLFDGKLSYKNKGLTIFATVNNIFNTDYNDIENVIQPGRWYKAGVAYRFSFK